MNYVLRLMYEGTHYAGWQRQQNAVTIQGELEKALSVITRQDLSVTGSSRTDAGVHAAFYIANFTSDEPLDCYRLCRGLNALLPQDIRVVSATPCRDDFNARFDAVSKTYLYRIDTSLYGDVFLRNFAWHVPHALDVAAMQKAASYFIGSHDFSAFMAQGSTAKTFTRDIYDSRIEQHGDMLEFYITGGGFLYNMVRIIAGTLVAVGKHKLQADSIPAIIASRDRTKAGMTAPPQGLTLYEATFKDFSISNETE